MIPEKRCEQAPTVCGICVLASPKTSPRQTLRSSRRHYVSKMIFAFPVTLSDLVPVALQRTLSSPVSFPTEFRFELATLPSLPPHFRLALVTPRSIPARPSNFQIPYNSPWPLPACSLLTSCSAWLLPAHFLLTRCVSNSLQFAGI